MTSVLIIDDHPIVLQGCRRMLEDMAQRHRPARLALKSWGDGARFAGAKDRAAVSGLVLARQPVTGTATMPW